MKGHVDDAQVVLNMFMESKTFLKVKDVFNSLTKFLKDMSFQLFQF